VSREGGPLRPPARDRIRRHPAVLRQPFMNNPGWGERLSRSAELRGALFRRWVGSGQRLLEAGCGGGSLTRYFAWRATSRPG
jgi:2-polyprenyl-3-methyl-5-hydroxy-6-metoxy-1,4-benzoquinol methylase